MLDAQTLMTAQTSIEIIGGVLVVLTCVAALLCWSRGPARHVDAHDVFEAPEGPDDSDRSTNPALAEGERLSIWQVFPAEPVAYRGGNVSHRPDNGLGLFGRMRAAVVRVLNAQTRTVPVVAVASVPVEPESPTEPLPGPFNPLDPATPIPVPEIEPAVDTWALLGSERPAWDISVTAEWCAIDVSKVPDPGPDYTAEQLARIEAEQDAAQVLAEVAA